MGRSNAISVGPCFYIGGVSLSIDLYSGTPGSGKSLHAARRIIQCLKTGTPVIGNFPVNLEFFRNKRGRMPWLAPYYYVTNSHMSVPFLKDYSRRFIERNKMHQCLVVIDECQILFNPRSSKPDLMQWVEFLPQHRKYGYDVLLVTPHDTFIDRQIRTCIEDEYKHRSLKNYGVWGWLFSLVIGEWFWVNSYWYGSKLKLSSDVFRFNKKLTALYDSFRLFAENQGDEDDFEQFAEKETE